MTDFLTQIQGTVETVFNYVLIGAAVLVGVAIVIKILILIFKKR